MALLDDVPQHVEVRVVGHARLADPPHRGAHGRLRAVDRLALAEAALVARAPHRGALLAAELDPLRVFDALADAAHEANPRRLPFAARVHPRATSPVPGHTLA